MKQSPPALCPARHALLELAIGARTVLIWCPGCGARIDWRPVLSDAGEPTTAKETEA